MAPDETNLIGERDTLAASEAIVIKSGDQTFGTIDERLVAEAVHGVPTDRPIPVDYTIIVSGSDVTEWEQAAAE